MSLKRQHSSMNLANPYFETESSKRYRENYEDKYTKEHKPPLDPSRGRRYSQKIPDGIASLYPNFGGKRRTNKKRSRRSKRRRQ